MEAAPKRLSDPPSRFDQYPPRIRALQETAEALAPWISASLSDLPKGHSGTYEKDAEEFLRAVWEAQHAPKHPVPRWLTWFLGLVLISYIVSLALIGQQERREGFQKGFDTGWDAKACFRADGIRT